MGLGKVDVNLDDEGRVIDFATGKPPILVPDKEHYIESLIKDLEDHRVEIKKRSESAPPQVVYFSLTISFR